MRKRPSSEQELQGGVKKPNLTNSTSDKEIYWFSSDKKRREFNTLDTIYDFCLHTTKHLIAICTKSKIKIYTLEGYLVTCWENMRIPTHPFAFLQNPGMYFSDHMMILTELHNELTRYNDFNVKQRSIQCTFDCDKNENIYSCTIEIKNNKSVPCIYIYSHDIEKIGEFRALDSLSGVPIAIRIKEDKMVVLFQKTPLNRKRSQYTILRFSLSKEELLQTVKFNRRHVPCSIFICFDPLNNVLIGSASPNKLAVWYHNGRIRYYETHDDKGSSYHNLTVGLAVNSEFTIIRPLSPGIIRIYEPMI